MSGRLSITIGDFEGFQNSIAARELAELKNNFDAKRNLNSSSWNNSAAVITTIAFIAMGIGIFYVLTHPWTPNHFNIGFSVIAGAVSVNVIFAYHAISQVKAYNQILDKELEEAKNKKAVVLPELEHMTEDDCRALLSGINRKSNQPFITDEQLIKFIKEEMNFRFVHLHKAIKMILLHAMRRLMCKHEGATCLKLMLDGQLSKDDCFNILSKLEPGMFNQFVGEVLPHLNKANVGSVKNAIVEVQIELIQKKAAVKPLPLKFYENCDLNDEQLKHLIFGVNLSEHVIGILGEINTHYFLQNESLPRNMVQILAVICQQPECLVPLKERFVQFALPFRFILILSNDVFQDLCPRDQVVNFYRTFQVMGSALRGLFMKCLSIAKSSPKSLQKTIHEIQVSIICNFYIDGFIKRRQKLESVDYQAIIEAIDAQTLASLIEPITQGMGDQTIEIFVLSIFKFMKGAYKELFLAKLKEDFVFVLFNEGFFKLAQSDSHQTLNTDEFLNAMTIFRQHKKFISLFFNLIRNDKWVYPGSEAQQLRQMKGGVQRLIGILFISLEPQDKAILLQHLSGPQQNKTRYVKFLDDFEKAHAVLQLSRADRADRKSKG